MNMRPQSPNKQIPKLTTEQLEYFWKHITVTADDCWIWTGIVSNGYGVMTNLIKAHRLSYQLHRDDPGSSCVLHRCDHPLCVNPDHLFLGTRLDNAQDRWAKGRGYQGQQHHMTKFADSDIATIRKLAETLPQAEIARRYGVSAKTINHIVRRRNWKHVA